MKNLRNMLIAGLIVGITSCSPIKTYFNGEIGGIKVGHYKNRENGLEYVDATLLDGVRRVWTIREGKVVSEDNGEEDRCQTATEYLKGQQISSSAQDIVNCLLQEIKHKKRK